jgi:hypothetical protein
MDIFLASAIRGIPSLTQTENSQCPSTELMTDNPNEGPASGRKKIVQFLA